MGSREIDVTAERYIPEWPVREDGLRVLNDAVASLLDDEPENHDAYAETFHGKEISEVYLTPELELLGIRHGSFRFVFNIDWTSLTLLQAGNVGPSYEGATAGIGFSETEGTWEDTGYDAAIINGVASYFETVTLLVDGRGAKESDLERYIPLLEELDSYSDVLARVVAVELEDKN